MEAEHVKKKLNGAILKGKKIKIEEARPRKRRRAEESATIATHSEAVQKQESSKAKKPRKERNAIAGYELPNDRKVKRGWTQASSASTKMGKKLKDKPSSAQSKFSDQDELLFRTKVPANRIRAVEQGRKRKTKPEKHTDEYVVHEFEKTTKQPSFLRQDVGVGNEKNLKYIEGQGWVDDAGNIIEKESKRVRQQREAAKAKPVVVTKLSKSLDPAPSPKRLLPPPNKDGSHNGLGLSLEETHPDHSTTSSVSLPDPDMDTSSEGTSSEDDASSSESAAVANSQGEHPDVHPLEALFKKPSKPGSQDIAKPSLEIATSFSFFGSEDNDHNGKELAVPTTPFTSQELRSRGLRSAAPTPDTAHPSRFNSYGSTGLPGDEELSEGPDDDAGTGKRVEQDDSARKGRPQRVQSQAKSDFEKKFWEQRAENNRSWKSRRRAVLKEKRQRENKARRPKNW